MLYWPTMLKTVRLLGTKDEQGRMFGIMEAGRGLVDTVIAFLVTTVIMLLFAWMPHDLLNVYTGVAISLLISACIYSMRAVFFAPMDEVNVPRKITGSAMSMVLHWLLARCLHVRCIRFYP